MMGEASPSPKGSTINAHSQSARSRENTPSTVSSHSIDTALQRTTSGTSADASSGSSLGQSSQSTRNEEDMEKFLKKMDMEKVRRPFTRDTESDADEQKMQALQRRLELASVKASHGWTGMTINEIETVGQLGKQGADNQKLTPKSARRASSHVMEPLSPTRSAHGGYEPPSPSRPWQLIDVLWQPLPPPSGGKYPNSPLSPSSPRKRSRDQLEQLPQRSIFQQQQGMPRSAYPPMAGHRRSSSTVLQPASPLRTFKQGEKKRRSYSHSTQTTTRQDVDAAKALTSMLGSGSPTQASFRGRPDSPFVADAESSTRARAQSEMHLPPRRVRSNTPPKSNEGKDTEDKDAADLMLFLAHSPSPISGPRRIFLSRVGSGEIP